MADSDTPRRKRPRIGVRYQMELNFTTSEEKQTFLERLDRAKRRLSPGSRSYDNRELLVHLLSLVEDDSDRSSAATQTGSETSKDHPKPILECSGN